MLNRISIKTKTALIFILMITVLIAGNGAILYVMFGRILQDQIMVNLNQIMIQSRINIDNLTNSIERTTLLLYTDKTLSDILNKTNVSPAELYSDVNTLNLEINSLPLSSFLTSYSITFFADDNTPLAQELSETSVFYDGIFNSYGVSSQPWFKETIKNDGIPYWFVNKEKSRVFLCAGRLIKNPYIYFSSQDLNNASVNMGIVVLRFDISQIERQVEQSQLTPHTNIWIIDHDGNILYSKIMDEIGTNISAHPFASLLNILQGQKVFTYKINGERYMIDIHALNSGWQLIAAVPFSDILQRTAVIKSIIGLTLIISVASGIPISFIISNSITQPIKKLAHIMKGIENHENMDISVVPISHSGNEVRTLYESFNHMMKRINSLINDVYISKIREKESELKALQAQINPHFLYNTLDSINWLALDIGADRIALIISSLSDILRYSIENIDEPVTIAREIEHVKKYIDIQLICYEADVNVEFCIDSKVLQHKVPKLILQPLVENALLHGLGKAERSGHIVISGSVRSDRIILSVEDNGIGADTDELNAYLKGKKSSFKDSKSYGIKNVDQRLKLSFGEDYGLMYETNASGGVTAIVTLPYKSS